ncbi:MAG: biotin--[Mogibacterium sp.]|nr:biotin--[acetyl-CoA-carboxylase] ligase [Mogibacterium sp.]
MTDRQISTFDTLSKAEISALLPEPLRKQVGIVLFDTIDSTNNAAKDPVLANRLRTPEHPVLPDELLFLAEEQTAGRGRLGRSFYSPRGSGIYMTYSFRPCFPLAEVTQVTPIAAVAAHRVLSRYSAGPLRIKWVNDLYRGDRKITGILVEGIGSTSSGNFERIIIGIGINCTPAAVPEELRGIAGSLTDDPHPDFTRNQLIAAITAELHNELTRTSLSDPERLAYYRANCYLTGKDVTVHPAGAPSYRAKALGISDTYAMVVQVGDKIVELTSGEVSVRTD